MESIIVQFNDGEKEIKGQMISQDIRHTIIKDETGREHKVDTDYVTLVEAEITNEMIKEYLDHVFTHYIEAEIPEVEKELVQKVLEKVKKKY